MPFQFAESKLQLTDQSVAELPSPGSGRYLVRDSELPGFFLQVGRRTKTYMVQADLRTDGSRQTIRLKIGTADRMTTRKARAVAKEKLGKIGRGEDPRDRPKMAESRVPPEPTLRDAWTRYREALERKGRSLKTIEGYGDHVERLMAVWLDTSLKELGDDPKKVIDRHDDITSVHGPYMANSCMRTLRAIYNHARKSRRSLPADNPVSALDWNAERRRDTGMGLKDLRSWFKQARTLNPLRREFQLLLLLSGSRPGALKRVKPQHVDFQNRILHVPKPKGGENRAFDIPLSRPMCRCLIRAIRIARMLYPVQAEDWIFPSDSVTGHLVEHKESRKILAKWGNDLRQTFRTIGQAAGVSPLDMHLLMNHSVPGVNAGYITRPKLLSDHLRSQQERISMMALSSADGDLWPFLTSRKLANDLQAESLPI